MAITSARMQIKRGNEVDFDAEKMLVGEWALSTDKRIVRICVAPNVCIRMATYDAFEVDMAKIEKILEECQTIEDAVELINSQVSEKLQATIEYTNQAKQYRDETEQFRNEVESMVDIGIATTERAGIVKPDGITIRVDEDGTIHADNGTVDYNELENKPSINGMELSENKSLDELGIASVEALEETNSKVNIIIEKAELNIKNTAKSDNLHLTDSANGKFVDFSLYGKAEQKQYSGKNLFNLRSTNESKNGIEFTTNDGMFSASGTATAHGSIVLADDVSVLQDVISQGGTLVMSLKNAIYNGSTCNISIAYKEPEATTSKYLLANGKSVSVPEGSVLTAVTLYFDSGVTLNLNNVGIQLERASVVTDYEPYVGGIPSPNPEYPQEITVAGASGSVEVVSCGKNFWNPSSKTTNENGVERTGITVPSGTYTISNNSDGDVFVRDGLASKDTITIKTKTVQTFTFSLDGFIWIPPATIAISDIQVEHGTVATEYEPYTETTSTIPTPNGLCGIKVSSGGNYVDENGQQRICNEIVKYADGSGKRIQRIASVDMGTLNWVYGSPYFKTSDLIGIVKEPINSGSKSYILSTCFIAKDYSYLVNNNNSIAVIYSTSGSHGMIWCKASDYTDVESFLEMVSGQYLYYELAEPIITDLSAEEIAEIEKLHTFYPVTNISNDADCGMSITYMADAKNYIDQRLALIESAMINNI